jgi:hypothetical protein
MGRDPSDTFDAEILPGGKRRQLTTCDTCDGRGFVLREYPNSAGTKPFDCPDCDVMF